jgi:ABC-type transport system involved in multi-copper enzyme maturation permease subunit
MLLTFGFSVFELLQLTNMNFFEYTFLPYLDLNVLNKLDYVNVILGVNLSLKKSIIINSIYSILFFIIGIYIFNKKDIKC